MLRHFISQQPKISVLSFTQLTSPPTKVNHSGEWISKNPAVPDFTGDKKLGYNRSATGRYVTQDTLSNTTTVLILKLS